MRRDMLLELVVTTALLLFFCSVLGAVMWVLK